MSLDERPARKLTSREIAKIVTAQLGGLAEWCDAADIMDAITHIHEHRAEYEHLFNQIRGMSQIDGLGPGGQA